MLIMIGAQLKEVMGCLKYVGINWYIFHVLQLLLFRFTQQYTCCISKSTMNHMHDLD